MSLFLGSTIWLPVQVSGALLSIGDLHAAMGQGEGALVAIESGGAATVRVSLVKQMGMPFKNNGSFFCFWC